MHCSRIAWEVRVPTVKTASSGSVFSSPRGTRRTAHSHTGRWVLSGPRRAVRVSTRPIHSKVASSSSFGLACGIQWPPPGFGLANCV